MFLYILATDELTSFDVTVHTCRRFVCLMVQGYFSVGELVLFPLCARQSAVDRCISANIPMVHLIDPLNNLCLVYLLTWQRMN